MAPAAIAERARKAGLNAIALTDHNCTFNLPAFAAVCRRMEMECLYGMEVTSVEEAHILCLFDQLEAAMELGGQVYASLPDVPNHDGRFGDQPIIDADENIVGFAEKFLVSASGFDVSALVDAVHALGGLVIPAHIDRDVYGIVSQLGFLPDEAFDAVELTPYGNESLAKHYPVVRHSDSHQLDAVGSVCTEYEMAELSISQLRSALSAGRG
jgi:PHP family Zn ribbon phosphoesterase